MVIACLMTHHVKAIEELSKSEQEKTNRNTIRSTPFYEAIVDNNAPSVLALLESFSINSVDGVGRTPLMEAALLGRTDMVLLLLDSGANIDMQSMYGETALIRAAYASQRDVIVVLLERGADKTLVDGNGNPARMIALFEGRNDIADLVS